MSIVLHRPDVLPRLGWAHATAFDRDLLNAVRRVEFPQEPVANKPRTGGLWCSPLVCRLDTVMGSVWTVAKERYATDWSLWEITPDPDARVLRVDSLQDLFAAIEVWGDRRTPVFPDGARLLFRRRAGGPLSLDWAALAGDVDVFWLTERGCAETGDLNFEAPRLWGWDVPTALLLTDRFQVGGAALPVLSVSQRHELVAGAVRSIMTQVCAHDPVLRMDAQMAETLRDMLTDVLASHGYDEAFLEGYLARMLSYAAAVSEDPQ